MSIQAQFEAARAVPSDIHEHLDTLVSIIKRLDAKKVIELGVRFGNSTLALLHGLEQTDGHLWSIDVSRQWVGIHSERWTFIQGDDLDSGVLSQLPGQVDVVFVDTTHTYEQTKREILAYTSFVREGGVMVFHDTNVAWFDHHIQGTEPEYPVRLAVNELLGSRPHNVWYNNHGLTEVQL